MRRFSPCLYRNIFFKQPTRIQIKTKQGEYFTVNIKLTEARDFLPPVFILTTPHWSMIQILKYFFGYGLNSVSYTSSEVISFQGLRDPLTDFPEFHFGLGGLLLAGFRRIKLEV